MRRAGWIVGILLCLGADWQAPRDAGDAAWERGDLAEALTHWSLALDAARTAPDAPVLDLTLRLAAAHQAAGDPATASALVGTARDLAAAPADHARVSVAEARLALDTGRLRHAVTLLEDAFATARAAADPDVAATAAANLGAARLATGDVLGAAEALEDAVRLSESLGDDAGRADALVTLGAAWLRADRLSDAREVLEEAIAVAREAGHGAALADAQANLGRVLQALGQDDDARSLYETALSTARSRRDVPRQAALLLNLGTLDQRRGDLAAADRRYAAAEAAWEAIGRSDRARAVALNRATLRGADPDRIGSVLAEATAAGDRRVEALASLDLGVLLRRQDPDRAADLADRAADLAAAIPLPEIAWKAAWLRGVIALDRGEIAAAVDALRAAADGVDRRRTWFRNDLALAPDEEAVYTALVDALLAAGDPRGAFVAAERLRRATLPRPSPGEDPAWDAARHLAAAEAALAPRADTEALRAELAELRVAFAHTVDLLRATHPDFDRRTRVAPEDLEALQADLPPGVVVLLPISLEDRLVLMTFSRSGLRVRTTDVGADEVARTVGRLARSLRAGLTGDPDWTRSQADLLGAWILAPIADDLADARTLVVSPAGPFRQLPFGLLRLDGAPLAGRLALASITHVGSLADRTPGRFRVTGTDLVLVGNPDGTLPGAEEEVRAIASHFDGARILTGPDATRSALLAAVDGRAVLHLATHGRIDPQVPDRSILVLGGEGPEGRLGYREIPGLAPWLEDTRLVVLSACESGRPVDAAPAETPGEVRVSIEGLAAQFRRAGVETLVASAWKVDDDATRALMERFYVALAAGHDVAEALRHGQAAVRAVPRWSHPWYWAGFTVVGDWR